MDHNLAKGFTLLAGTDCQGYAMGSISRAQQDFPCRMGKERLYKVDCGGLHS